MHHKILNTLFFHFFFQEISDSFLQFLHISIYLCNRNSTKNTFYYRQRCLINKMATGTVLILLSKVCILSLRDGSFCIWRTYLSNFCNENTQVYFLNKKIVFEETLISFIYLLFMSLEFVNSLLNLKIFGFIWYFLAKTSFLIEINQLHYNGS